MNARLFLVARAAALLLCGAGLAACGGGGGGPLGNAPAIANPVSTGGGSGQILSFVYFQQCVEPVLTQPISITVNGTTTSNTCAGGGCHASATGTGGALRLVPNAAPTGVTIDTVNQLLQLAQTPDVIRGTDIYKNFYSTYGETVVGQPDQSRLLNKPLVNGVLHGGGQIFASANDSGAQVFRYWISHPMPPGQDEFSSAALSMFSGAADPSSPATCNVN
jgi:hypothetical protein